MQYEAAKSYCSLFPDEKLNILLSYGLRNGDYNLLLMNKNRFIKSLILDSGTFTANNAKNIKYGKISFSGYLSYIKYLYNLCDYIFAYDKYFNDDDWEKNLIYLDETKKMGFNVVPVVHSYERPEIDTYLDRGYELIALGASTKKKEPNIVDCAWHIYKNKAKVHVLGGMYYAIYKTSPINFCDSSSWVHYSNYGDVNYIDQASGEKKTFKFADFIDSVQNTENEIQCLNEYLTKETNGKLSYIDLLKKNSVWRQVMNIHYYVKMQKSITEIHNSKFNQF